MYLQITFQNFKGVYHFRKLSSVVFPQFSFFLEIFYKSVKNLFLKLYFSNLLKMQQKNSGMYFTFLKN